MLRQLYTLLYYLLQPAILLMMGYLSLRQPSYRKRMAERYGFYANLPRPAAGGIVVHAASVGEVIAATPLINALQTAYPNMALTVTTITPTGSARVKAAFGDNVHHVYLPFDLPGAVKRFLRFSQPSLFIVIETELWPNLISQISSQNIPLVIANARLSARSASRYGKIKSHLQPLWQQIDLILAQDAVSGQRYIDLGFPADKLVCVGNLKFDISVSNILRDQVQQTAEQLGIDHRPVWIAGSTHEGEEQLILNAHRLLRKSVSNLLLILVPRHPERFGNVENLLKSQGFHYRKRSEKHKLLQTDSVLLGDTMGEMMLLYGLANIAFVGGSLVKHGGHNPLEPIAFQLPVISGKHTFNFPEIFTKLCDVQGVLEVESNAENLTAAVAELLNNAPKAHQTGQAAFAVLQENQGALARHLAQIDLLRNLHPR